MEHINAILSRNLPVKPRIRGFTKVPNWFIGSSQFSTYEKIIGIIIQKHQMNKGRAWPGQKRIADQAGCSVSTVKKAIKGLSAKKVLTFKRSEKGRNNIYQIDI